MKKVKRKLNEVLSQGDLEAIGDLMGGLMNKQLAVFSIDLKDVKVELKSEILKSEVRVKQGLKDYMHQGFETVMDGIDSLAEKLAEKEKVERIIEWARIVGDKVGVKPRV